MQADPKKHEILEISYKDIGAKLPFDQQTVTEIIDSRDKGYAPDLDEDSIMIFRTCLDTVDDTRASFDDHMEIGEIEWDETKQTGSLILSCDWYSHHQCSDMDGEGTAEADTYIEVNEAKQMLVLYSTRNNFVRSTEEEF